jgi:V8-like Glu-specific endopeptidase
MRRFTPLLFVCLFCSTSFSAQSPAVPVFAQDVAYPYASGEFTNDTNVTALMHSHEVHIEGVPSARVFFEDVSMGNFDFIVVTSFEDGVRHELPLYELEKWQDTSGYFNGDRLLVELYLAPSSTGSYTIDHLSVGIAGGYETICGAIDDRVPSFDNRAVRMLNSSGTSACSGWLASNSSCVLSAGHCFPGLASVAEVNVPLSNPNGSFNHPPIEDQFSVQQNSLQWVNGGPGNDWAMAQLFANNLGQTAADLHGFYEIGFFQPAVGETIRITGYGSDSGTSDQIQQTHTGPHVANVGDRLQYAVDTTGGSSGSVVIHEPSGMAVGIHTHGGCSSGGGSNSGTSMLNAGFMAAWVAMVDCSCPPAMLASRTASGNLNAYAATPPVLGGAMIFTVIAPYSNGIIFATAAQANIPLGNGQTLLVDTGASFLFNSALVGLPFGGGQMNVPSDPALCGRSAATQAILIGPTAGGPPFQLTNAQDVTVGS